VEHELREFAGERLRGAWRLQHPAWVHARDVADIAALRLSTGAPPPAVVAWGLSAAVTVPAPPNPAAAPKYRPASATLLRPIGSLLRLTRPRSAADAASAPRRRPAPPSRPPRSLVRRLAPFRVTARPRLAATGAVRGGVDGGGADAGPRPGARAVRRRRRPGLLPVPHPGPRAVLRRQRGGGGAG
jgi:hypothetical protein